MKKEFARLYLSYYCFQVVFHECMASLCSLQKVIYIVITRKNIKLTIEISL